MRHPWRRRARRPGPSAADEALEISQRQRERAAERRTRDEHMAARMRRMREVNHLAEAFQRAFGEGR